MGLFRKKEHNLLKPSTHTYTQLLRQNLSVTFGINLILAACIFCLTLHRPATAQTINIPDPGLRAVLEAALGKEAGADITQSDMKRLESLHINGCHYLTLSEKRWWTPVEERWICEAANEPFVSSIKDLTGIEFATNLIVLELGRNQISDVTPIKGLINLTRLSLGINQISDVTPLKNLTNLTRLSLIYNQISDVTPLKNLTKLIELDLDDNQISDVTPLKNLTNLTHLSLKSNKISDLSPIKDLTKLTYIFLRDNKLSDLSPLKDMTNLTYLNSGLNYRLSDISALKNLTKLKVLDLDDNQILDATPVKNMTDLRDLDISSNRISNVTPLKDLTKLTGLDLDSNRISDISALKDITNLIYLDIHENEISDVAPLTNMTNMRRLELNDNAISDLTPLKNMTKLTVLDLSYNHISDFSPITNLIDNLIKYDFSNQTEPPFSPADVNRDGTVNLVDLVAIASNFTDPDLETLARMNIYPDVNSDGLVNLIDLLIVASKIGADAASPTISKNLVSTSYLTAENLTKWIQLAKRLNVVEPNLQQGIDVLEQLLAILRTQNGPPETTALLPNYPNPFNPETWIPYQLAEPAKVSIAIHAVDGKLIRRLALGRLPAGMYHSKSRAAHWDGRNEFGDPIASGIYFYTLTAGDFTVSRKMLIRK